MSSFLAAMSLKVNHFIVALNRLFSQCENKFIVPYENYDGLLSDNCDDMLSSLFTIIMFSENTCHG